MYIGVHILLYILSVISGNLKDFGHTKLILMIYMIEVASFTTNKLVNQLHHNHIFTIVSSHYDFT